MTNRRKEEKKIYEKLIQLFAEKYLMQKDIKTCKQSVFVVNHFSHCFSLTNYFEVVILILLYSVGGFRESFWGSQSDFFISDVRRSVRLQVKCKRKPYNVEGIFFSIL